MIAREFATSAADVMAGAMFGSGHALHDDGGDPVPPVEGCEPDRTPRTATHARAGEVILLAEDQEPVRVLARLILEQHGYRVHLAKDGADGLVVAESLPAIDLLVTDVVMPRLTGPQLATELGRRRPGLRVLYMSGYVGDQSMPGVAFPIGAPLLPKPFTPASLLDAVRQRLDTEPDTPPA